MPNEVAPHITASGQMSGVTMRKGSSTQPSSVGERAGDQHVSGPEPLRREAERHLQRDVAGDHRAEQRRHARLVHAVAQAVDGQKREERLLERGRDEYGEQQDRREREEAAHRRFPAGALGAVEARQAGQRWRARQSAQPRNAAMPTRNGGQPSEPTRMRASGPAAKPAEITDV